MLKVFFRRHLEEKSMHTFGYNRRIQNEGEVLQWVGFFLKKLRIGC